MDDESVNVQPAPWRCKSRASFYFYLEGRTEKGWRIQLTRIGEDAKAALGVQSFPKIAFRDEAHSQRTCRRCECHAICVLLCKCCYSLAPAKTRSSGHQPQTSTSKFKVL